MEELDTGWIENYDENEKNFIANTDVNEVPVKQLNIYALYINKRNELEKIKVTDIELERVLKKDKLLTLIKEKSQDENIRYKLIGLLKYNIELKHDELY